MGMRDTGTQLHKMCTKGMYHVMKCNTKSILALLLTLVIVMSCFAACGSSDTDNETTAVPAATTAADVTAEPTGTDLPVGSESSSESNPDSTSESNPEGHPETADGEQDSQTEIPTEQETEVETEAPTLDKNAEIAATKAEIGQPDWGKKSFTCLVSEDFKSEICAEDGTVDGEGGSSQVLNDAVLARNLRLEEACDLTFDYIVKNVDSMTPAIRNEAASPTGDFILIDYKMRDGSTTQALAGNLRDWQSMDIDIDRSWWDSGTADFALRGKTYFMTGDANYHDDNFTYVMIFNKDMRKTYEATIPDLYQTVLDQEWTLDYFNTIIQGISADNGDGVWDENDTYGFVATYEGNTFFIGAGLRYIKNDRSMAAPELALDADMDKAMEVLELTKTVFHANHATYMSPLGEEGKGLSCFQNGRAMFYSEIASYLPRLSSEMDTDYGILPIPKYDKAQQNYRTWTYCGAPALSVTVAVSDEDAVTVGKIIQWYAMLSSEEVKPAFYDVMLTGQSVRDEESIRMLDIIFADRVYEMSFYFVQDFKLYDLFRNDVCENKNTFAGRYKSVTKNFDSKVQKLFKTLDGKAS